MVSIRLYLLRGRNMHPIVKKYMLLFEKISNTTKMSKTYNTDVDIYRSEIHIIQLIGERKELYVSEISKLIGVTKGTISEIVKRLESKGLVNKYTDSTNKTRQLVALTPKGKTAYDAHNNYHRCKDRDLDAYVETLSEKQKAVIEGFLEIASNMIEEH